ncbi:MAG TPA: non-canonical purine NTP pyrophosphatase [Nannocystaceae bacterium]|nr:non-canonical purine NTP pyrophosphatase [Nannocystaceae bacterium]
MILVLATANAGKLDELRVLLGARAFELRTAAELGIVLPEETGTSYVANARLKAEAVARASGELALGDDTGLEVAMLGGAPGIATADFAAQLGGWRAACEELARRTGLHRGADVRATLCCALVLANPDGTHEIGEARIAGRLAWPPTNAPGLAAIFVPDPPERLLADGVLVHRRRAFEQLTKLGR